MYQKKEKENRAIAKTTNRGNGYSSYFFLQEQA